MFSNFHAYEDRYATAVALTHAYTHYSSPLLVCVYWLLTTFSPHLDKRRKGQQTNSKKRFLLLFLSFLSQKWSEDFQECGQRTSVAETIKTFYCCFHLFVFWQDHSLLQKCREEINEKHVEHTNNTEQQVNFQAKNSCHETSCCLCHMIELRNM